MVGHDYRVYLVATFYLERAGVALAKAGMGTHGQSVEGAYDAGGFFDGVDAEVGSKAVRCPSVHVDVVEDFAGDAQRDRFGLVTGIGLCQDDRVAVGKVCLHHGPCALAVRLFVDDARKGQLPGEWELRVDKCLEHGQYAGNASFHVAGAKPVDAPVAHHR